MDYFTRVLTQKIVNAKMALEDLDNHLTFHQEFLDRKPQPEDVSDVHTAHCCEYHKSCKYGAAHCPVKTGLKQANYPCNCDW